MAENDKKGNSEKGCSGNGEASAAPGPPGILTGEEIEELQLIEPLNNSPTYLKATSYDLTLGPEVYICGQGEPKLINLSTGSDTVEIDSFGTIIFSTKEKIKLGKYTNIVGHLGLRIEYGLKGFILQVGPQMEPGYNGPLFGALLNTRNEQKFISRDARFLTVEFYRSVKPVSIGPTGKFKQKTINSLREFLTAQNIEENTLVVPSLVKQIEDDFEECKREHGIQLARREHNENRNIAKKQISLKKIGIAVAIVAIVITIILFILNHYIKRTPHVDNSGKTLKVNDPNSDLRQLENSKQNKQVSDLSDKTVIEPNGLDQEQKKDSTSNIVEIYTVLKDKPTIKSNGIGLEQKITSGPNDRSIRKDHNEP